MEILLIMLAIELSGMEGSSIFYQYENKERLLFEQTYFLTFEAEIQIYELLYIKGSAKTLMYFEKDISGNPRALSSYFETGIRFNGLSAGWRHICIHPIIPYAENLTTQLFVDQVIDELFIRFEMEQKIF